DSSTYTLQLPQYLLECWIHPTFHAILLQRHEPNDDALFPRHKACAFYNVRQPDDTEYMVEEITAHHWEG
ncbi:hypothetical protein PAXINDRAFT_51156, partial [Paxillus involutus ATCC 200175]